MAAPTELSRSSDASFLRRLLERQAACLVRVRLDGVLLACNQAALGLFGVGEQRAVLNSNLIDRLVPAEGTQWHEFVAQCSAKGAASFECHLVIRDNNARPVLLQGVPLTDHPDGVESLLLLLRDQSQTQRLDHSIESARIDHFENEERRRAGDQIEAAIAERLKLAVLADEDQAECLRLVEALEAQTADRRGREARVVELEKKVEQSRLVLLQKEREYGRDVAMLKSALAAAHAARAAAGDEKQELEATRLRLQAATAEQERLQALVADHEVDRERIAADRQAAVDTLQQSLARTREDAALDIEQSGQALAASRLELAQALAEQTRIAARVEEQTREQDLMRVEHQSALLDLEDSKRAALAELRSQLAQTSAEHGSLVAQVEAAEGELALQRAEHERAHDGLLADHQRALADVQAGTRDELEALERRLQAATAEHARLQALVEEGAVNRERLAADHRAAVDTLQQSLVRAGEDAALEVEQSRQEWAASRLELVQALAEQSRIAARVEEQTREQELMRAEHERAHDRLIAEHHRALADLQAGKRDELESLEQRLQTAAAEHGRLQALVAEHEGDRERLAADNRAAVDMLQQSLARAREDAALEVEQSRQEWAASRLELVQALAEQSRIAARIDEQTREQELMRAEHERALDRLVAEHQRALADLQTNKRDELEALDRRLQAAAAEYGRREALAKEDAVNRERIAGDHLAAVDTLQQALAESRSALAQALAEQGRIAARVEEQTREQELMRVEHERAHDGLLAEHQRVLADLQAGKRDELESLEQRLQAAAAEHGRLQARVAEHEGDRERLAADHRAAVDMLEQSLARAREDAALEVEQSRQEWAASRLELVQALAEQSRIAARVDEQTREQELMRAEHERALDRLVAEHQRALADLQTSKRDELEALERRLQAAAAEHLRLEAVAKEDAVNRERADADHRAAVDTLQQSLVRTREEAALDIEQSRQALAESRLELAQALAEQTRIATRVEEQTREQDLMRGEHQSALLDLEFSKHAALTELRAQLVQTSAEQARLAAQVEAAESELAQQRAEHERAHGGLIAEHHRALADLQTCKRDEQEALERRLQAAAAEHGRLQALVEDDAVNRERIAADHRVAVDTLEQSLARTREEAAIDIEQSRQALAESRLALAQSLAEQTRIAARVEEQARDQQVMRAEHERALADVETSKREALDELRSQLSQTLADQRRLAALLEQHERDRDNLIVEHHRVLADMESGKREALAELRSQLSQAFVDQRRLASHADEQELEVNRLRAEHQAALAETETRHRDALVQLRRELAQTAERASQHEREHISAEHALAIADLQASNENAAAELRSQLSDAVAERHRLTALIEEHARERERVAAEHRRAIADLQASKQEAVAECERVLTEVQQALLVRDTSRRLEIERRLIDGIDEGPQIKVDGQRLAALQRGLTTAFSQMHAVLKDGPAPKRPLEAEHEPAEDADLLHEPFDDADDAFVHQLLEGIHANRVPETHADPKTVGPAQPVSETLALKTDDQPADDIFDAKDATFARRLMDTLGPVPQSSAAEDS